MKKVIIKIYIFLAAALLFVFINNNSFAKKPNQCAQKCKTAKNKCLNDSKKIKRLQIKNKKISVCKSRYKRCIGKCKLTSNDNQIILEGEEE
jgi:hypothetical protein